MKRKCKECGVNIRRERLAALPGVETCVDCSDEKPLTTADVVIDGADPNDAVDSSQTCDLEQ